MPEVVDIDKEWRGGGHANSWRWLGVRWMMAGGEAVVAGQALEDTMMFIRERTKKDQLSQDVN